MQFIETIVNRSPLPGICNVDYVFRYQGESQIQKRPWVTLPRHRKLVGLDKHQSAAWRPRHRQGQNLGGTGSAGLSEGTTFLPQGDTHAILSCGVRHLTTVSPNPASV